MLKSNPSADPGPEARRGRHRTASSPSSSTPCFWLKAINFADWDRAPWTPVFHRLIPPKSHKSGVSAFLAVGMADRHGFNPRVPCGTRQSRARMGTWLVVFQSTRPVRDATRNLTNKLDVIGFQSTRPVRDATSDRDQSGKGFAVSIHASRAGRDLISCPPNGSTNSFNPRVPCGTRRFLLTGLTFDLRFQSTRPVRDATSGRRVAKLVLGVSIHASRAGRDREAIAAM